MRMARPGPRDIALVIGTRGVWKQRARKPSYLNSKSQLESSNGSLPGAHYASNAATSFPLCARHQYCRKGNSPNARRMGNHNQEARCLQADSDTRKSMLAGPRSEEVGFGHDSALEGAGFEPSVPPRGTNAFLRLPPFDC